MTERQHARRLQGAPAKESVHSQEHGESRQMQAIILGVADVAMRLSRTYRTPRYDMESRESDAEHSVMLALQSMEIAAHFFPELDPAKVAQFALIHELIEIIGGDQQTFVISDEDLASREQLEDDNIDLLCAQLPPYIGSLVREYQQHVDPHARMVGLCDKTAPVAVDILGPGSEFMHEDYGVHTRERLEQVHAGLINRYQTRYPEPELHTLHTAQHGLMRYFESVFKPTRANEHTQETLI